MIVVGAVMVKCTSICPSRGYHEGEGPGGGGSIRIGRAEER